MKPRLFALAVLTLFSPFHSEAAKYFVLPPTGPTGPFQRIATGFVYTEGPVFDAHGNLYFTDQLDHHGKIYRMDSAGEVSLLVADSGMANGLKINAQNELVACQMREGRIVAYSLDGKHCRVIASGFCGKRFNAPNDLVIDKQGGIYFTDPCFHAPRPRPQHNTCVYYVAPDGAVTRLIDDLHSPNGIGLSADETTLTVVPSAQPEIMAYTLEAPGKIGAACCFAKVAKSWNPIYVGGDGMTYDSLGNLYVTMQPGIQVFDPQGNTLGIIPTPERPGNLVFGGPDRKTLYVTAKSSIYTVPMAVSGR